VKNILKSIGAVVAGLVVLVVLTTIVDKTLEYFEVIPKDTLPRNGSELLIVGVLVYQGIFSVIGCYLAARLAPAYPLRHALALGVVGVVFSTLGSIAMKDAQPVWYSIILVVMSLPLAWLGGKLAEQTRR
jgi:uncharacterized membrane protein YfcA